MTIDEHAGDVRKRRNATVFAAVVAMIVMFAGAWWLASRGDEPTSVSSENLPGEEDLTPDTTPIEPGDVDESEIVGDDPSAEPTDTTPDPPDEELARVTVQDAAAELFADGVSAEELDERWDGYPYGDDEKSERIARYQSDFAWVQENDIDVEVNFYLQFGDPQFFQPIITVRSVTEAETAAAFVMVWNESELTFGRIPEPSSGLEAIDSDETSITVSGVGVEGGVSAFHRGRELVAKSDYETLTTTIHLPSAIDSDLPITVVFASPELPGAGILWIEEPQVWPPQLNVEARTPLGINRAGGRAIGLVAETSELVEIDLETGSVVRVIAQLPNEGHFFGDLQLNWDGTAALIAEGVEDAWFSCESSPGAIRRVDFADGSSEVVATGAEPRLSPDGTRLAYLAASTCIPDPDNAGNWVLTIYDSVVVRDLETGEEQTWTDEALQAAIVAEGDGTGSGGDLIEAQYSGLSWVNDDELAVGTLRLDPQTMEELERGLSTSAEVGSTHTVLGFYRELDAFILGAKAWVDESDRLLLTALMNDGTFRPLSPSTVTAAAFDSTYENFAILDRTQLWIDGDQIELDVELSSFDW